MEVTANSSDQTTSVFDFGYAGTEYWPVPASVQPFDAQLTGKLLLGHPALVLLFYLNHVIMHLNVGHSAVTDMTFRSHFCN